MSPCAGVFLTLFLKGTPVCFTRFEAEPAYFFGFASSSCLTSGESVLQAQLWIP